LLLYLITYSEAEDPPIPILVLIVSATALGLYGSKKATD